MRVALSHWKPGFKKIRLNHLLRDRAGMSLSEAKAAVDRVLVGEEVAVEIADEKFENFIEAANQCGVQARQCIANESQSPARA